MKGICKGIYKGIYVHIPFCVRKCRYCDFQSFDNAFSYVPLYIDALQKEIKNSDSFFASDSSLATSVDSIFIGGGTPSCIPPKYIALILEALSRKYNITSDAEITMEANPGTVDLRSLLQYKSYGINRISFGIQSFDDELLLKLGRIHTGRLALDALHFAAEASYKSINADLIFAIPSISSCKEHPSYKEQSTSDFMSSVKIACDAGVSHISTYSMIIEPETPYGKMLDAGLLSECDDAADREMYHSCRQYLLNRGFTQYEISNYALSSDYVCRHNIKYWTGEEYKGFGLAAASYLKCNDYYVRTTNSTYLKDYINGKYHGESIKVFKSEQMMDFMMLGFRMISGPSAKRFNELFSYNYDEIFARELSSLHLRGLIKATLNGGYCLTDKGLDYANEVFREFV